MFSKLTFNIRLLLCKVFDNVFNILICQNTLSIYLWAVDSQKELSVLDQSVWKIKVCYSNIKLKLKDKLNINQERIWNNDRIVIHVLNTDHGYCHHVINITFITLVNAIIKKKLRLIRSTTRSFYTPIACSFIVLLIMYLTSGWMMMI